MTNTFESKVKGILDDNVNSSRVSLKLPKKKPSFKVVWRKDKIFSSKFMAAVEFLYSDLSLTWGENPNPRVSADLAEC